MDNQWTNPHTGPQCHYVVQTYAYRLSKGSLQCLILQVPPTAERNDQPNAPAHTQDANAAIPNCPCPMCSDARRRQPDWYPIEQQDQQRFGDAVAPFVNHGQRPDNRQETASGAPDHVWAQIAHPETGIQDNIGYAPVPERAGPPNVGLLHAPILDASIAEGRRRLAGRYLNNPDAYVRMIRLEPGPSGQFRIIITLEMANIL
ncbi:hypothetical protein EDB84DRAFT_1442344 [Lactarius hengduanensis]|nr:hypothetical protein EDB84DRAFT_1442344 [Lactarius hengduanensis]